MQKRQHPIAMSIPIKNPIASGVHTTVVAATTGVGGGGGGGGGVGAAVVGGAAVAVVAVVAVVGGAAVAVVAVVAVVAKAVVVAHVPCSPPAASQHASFDAVYCSVPLTQQSVSAVGRHVSFAVPGAWIPSPVTLNGQLDVPTLASHVVFPPVLGTDARWQQSTVCA
jgi:hypothetical protein